MCLDTIYVWILTKDHLLDGACPISNQMNVLTHLGKTWKLISKHSPIGQKNWKISNIYNFFILLDIQPTVKSLDKGSWMACLISKWWVKEWNSPPLKLGKQWSVQKVTLKHILGQKKYIFMFRCRNFSFIFHPAICFIM